MQLGVRRAESGSSGPSIISAPNKRFNGELLTIIVPIADSYTCTGLACWYKFKYVYTGDVNDTSTYLDGVRRWEPDPDR